MAEGTRMADMRRDMDDLKEHVRSGLEELRNMIVALATHYGGQASNETPTGAGETGGESPLMRGQNGGIANYQVPTRCSRVEFPKFDGEDLRGWVYRCEQFFEVDETPSEAKVKLAAVHLEGRALQWHQMYMKSRLTREVPNWGEYIRALNDRFGTLLYEDPMSELVNLKQTGTIQEYLDRFDELMNCVELSEPYAISCFLGGIKSEVAVHVRMFRPKSLQEAISLAKLQEQANLLKKPNHLGILKTPPNLHRTISNQQHHKPNHQTSSGYNNTFSLTNSKSTLPNTKTAPTHFNRSKRLSPQEMDEKRAKGLCFWCDERFVPGHQCSKRRQLYVMELIDDEEEDTQPELVEENQDVTEEENGDDGAGNFQISVNAMTGSHNFNTMRVTGSCKGKAINILVDTGSTHNFLDLHMAKRLGCQMESTAPLPVAVADGSRLFSSYTCRGFDWKVQGVSFSTDMMILPLGGCDMVLGIQWLVTLGDINWNFNQLKMEFTIKGRKVSLRGKQPTEVKVVSNRQMQKLLQQPGQLLMMQMDLIQSEEEGFS